MSFDSLVLRAVTEQLNKTILNGQILGVVQYSQYDFILRILANERTYNLLFSVHPVYARIHLISDIPQNKNRWHFADFLQTHIKRGKISLIEQVDFDRIIKIRIIPYEELIENSPKILIAEFMGKHSNAIILDEKTNKILESIKHIDESMSKYRQVLPGETYKLPPSSQNLDLLSEDDIKTLVSNNNEWERSMKNFKGMSPLLTKEIIARAKHEPLLNVIMQIRDDIINSRYLPNVVINDRDEVIAVSPFILKQYIDNEGFFRSINFSDISSALEYYFSYLIEKATIESERNAILQTVRKRQQDLQEKQDAIAEQLEVAKSAEELKIKGELIIANLQNIKRGQKEVTLSNPYESDSPELIIMLDEKLSPSDNAQKYFDKYKKAKKSKDFLDKIYSKNESMISYLQDIIQRIEKVSNLEELSLIRNDLLKRGILKDKTISSKKNNEETSLFRIFRSSDNFQIYVGRNERENDMLIKESAGKYDMWLHAKQIEGSHVIIRNPEKKTDIPKRTLLEAAIIAANFSKAKHSSIVPVDYTWIKYVTKPRRAKPGFVNYTHEKTLFVSPEDFNKIFLSKSDL